LAVVCTARCGEPGADDEAGPFCVATVADTTLEVPCRPARFGTNHASVVRAELALASPAQACKSADGASPLQLLRPSGAAHNRTSAEVDAGGSSGSGGGGGSSSEGLAVLVDRGGCSFGEKVEVAVAAGASVVLVGNTRESELKSAAKQARGRGWPRRCSACWI